MPLVLSAVFVFIASSLIHMVLGWHNKQYQPHEAGMYGGVASRVIHVGYHGMRSAYRQYRRRQASSKSPAA